MKNQTAVVKIATSIVLLCVLSCSQNSQLGTSAPAKASQSGSAGATSSGSASGNVSQSGGGSATPAQSSAVSTPYIDAVSCAGINAVSVLQASFQSEGSNYTCQQCASYFPSDSPTVNVGPFTACVRSLNNGSGPAEIQALIPAVSGTRIPAGYDWTVNFSCQPAAESECNLPAGQMYEGTPEYGVTTQYGGPYDVNALPAGLVVE